MKREIQHFLKKLPQRVPLLREDLLVDELLLHRDSQVSVYYAPFERVNTDARIALIGVTPGFQQMEMLYRSLRDSIPDAHVVASFAGGTMRNNLVGMLDCLNIPDLLGISSTLQLFSARSELLHTTSVVRHPVFRTSGLVNYTGHSPHERLSLSEEKGQARSLPRV